MDICVLGATGLVGRETLSLVDRAWPGATLHLYASRDQTIEHAGHTLSVRAAERLLADHAPRGDLALVALDDEHSARYCPRLLELGFRVIDKSNTYRGDPNVPLVVAGVNDRLLDDGTRLAANPNCTTIPFALAVRPLQRAFGLRAATVSTYQAVSGAGIGALDEFLDAARVGFSTPRRLGDQLDPRGYAGNVVPHAGKTDDSGFSAEERKLAFESRKILDLPAETVNAQCCRVGVAVGHYENAWIELERPASLDEVAEQLDAAPFVRRVPGPAGDGLSALACVHDRDLTLVGRLRKDPRDRSGRTICATIVADNLRLGAATNAVRAASRWFPSRDPELQVGDA
jgi:aspartate-semialdehyde dehydrogenase